MDVQGGPPSAVGSSALVFVDLPWTGATTAHVLMFRTLWGGLSLDAGFFGSGV